jgi:hypothetical protein
LPFELRFKKDQIRYWAGKYDYRSGDADVLDIGARSRIAGYYTKDDFIKVCDWKTRGRPRRHYSANSEGDVREQTHIALTTPREELRITALTRLHGVGWPTASVLLQLAHTDPYPILDFRALWSLGSEQQYYTFEFWWQYVTTCRAIAAECNVSIRDLDRALWEYSRLHQPKRASRKQH